MGRLLDALSEAWDLIIDDLNAREARVLDALEQARRIRTKAIEVRTLLAELSGSAPAPATLTPSAPGPALSQMAGPALSPEDEEARQEQLKYLALRQAERKRLVDQARNGADG
jgi:hypothetical protein